TFRTAGRPGNPDFRALLNMLTSLPESIKHAIPEFEGLEKLMRDSGQLNGNVLRAFVETSGTAFETRLKVAVLKDLQSVLRNLIALQSEGDLKGALLRLKSLLKSQEVVQTLKQAGFRIPEISSRIEEFIRHIEFFQVTSKINDMFYTFLPVMWEGLKDSEFLFRRDKDGKDGSCTCDINLDLEKLGKLSVSVTVLEKAFFVSIFVEQPETAALISSGKKLLEERFASQGLMLKAVNINQKKGISFGQAQNKGVNLKI
ncbi:MAG: flagellar hook-length control protein FliK, partial [Nitrospiraceae bacterium]